MATSSSSSDGGRDSPGPARFNQTQWSVVLAAAGKQDLARAEQSLEKLCRTYWLPLYTFIRRQGESPHDAQDLTQEFFARLLEKDFLGSVDQAKGRFRSFLLASLKHFLSHQRDKARAQKRGGGQTPLSLDFSDLHDFGQTREYYYFIMEFVDGMNLRQLIQAKTLEPRQALELVTQICTALQFAHDEKIVHRAIKPENILITQKGQVKIADFGLAKLLGSQPDPSLTASQQVMGTVNYMAPEQRENTKDVDHRADIYSLGVVFYEMLTGEVPMGRFEPPSKKVQVDVRLDEVVLHALEREPARRYQHVSEVKSNVETITGTTPAAEQAASAPAKLVPKLPASNTSWIAFFVVEMALTLGLGVFFWQMIPALGVVWIVAVFLVASHQLNSRKEINEARENGLWPQPGELPTLEHVKLLARAGKQRLAIKLYRQIYGASVAEAKVAVEELDGQPGLEPHRGFELFPKEWSVTHAGHSIRVRNAWNRSLKLFVDDVCHASTDRIIILSKSRPLLRYEMATGTVPCIIEVYCRALLEVKVKIVVNGQWIGGDNF